MSHDPHLSLVPADAQGALLHQALRQTLTPPPVPADFRARVMAQLLSDQLAATEARRQALEQEHAQALARMRQGHLLLRRDTLALIVVSAFTAGCCANLALPWLRDSLGLDSALLVPTLALAVGAASTASVWLERLDWRGLLRMRLD